jgi:hypothetical protein
MKMPPTSPAAAPRTAQAAPIAITDIPFIADSGHRSPRGSRPADVIAITIAIDG